jgi:hypothetical protein
MWNRFNFNLNLKETASSVGSAVAMLYLGSMVYTNIGRPAVVQGTLVSCHFNRVFRHKPLFEGASMIPTFPACCSVVWFSRISLFLHPLKVGDVVAAQVMESDGHTGGVVKRVAAMGGDWVLNTDTGELVLVPPEHVWLLGDNPNKSRDSRSYGAIPQSAVIAKVNSLLV